MIIVLLTCRMSSTNVVDVYGNFLENIMTIVVASTHSTDVNFLKTFYSEKIGAFLLMEALYKALPGAIIKDRLNKKYSPGADSKGNELVNYLIFFILIL